MARGKPAKQEADPHGSSVTEAGTDNTTGTSTQGRAYSIWEAEGRPEGRDVDHWLQAEREAAEVVLPPVDGPIPERGAERSAEEGIEDVLETDEDTDPEVTGSASLIESS